jgi:hypothetical protein
MKTATMTAEKALSKIQDQAERIKSDETQRFPDAASVGDSHRQGDVYITLLNAVPENAVREKKPSTQLAPGTTQGSRHYLDSLAGVTMYRIPNPGMLDGPIIECETERTITHPEHGDVVLPAGIYGISYQRNLDAEERERRVQD